MNKYLLLLHEDMEAMQALSPQEMEELINSHMEWAKELGSQGALLEGDGLQEVSVKISGKDSVVKDSTYLEAKEMIGGYYLIQAENLDAAIEIAKNCPCHHWGGTTEVRPIMTYEE